MKGKRTIIKQYNVKVNNRPHAKFSINNKTCCLYSLDSS